jgi:hypothetical protein
MPALSAVRLIYLTHVFATNAGQNSLKTSANLFQFDEVVDQIMIVKVELTDG